MIAEVFVPATPSAVLTAERGAVRIVTKLYGAVSPERLTKEQFITNYRAEQLSK